MDIFADLCIDCLSATNFDQMRDSSIESQLLLGLDHLEWVVEFVDLLRRQQGVKNEQLPVSDVDFDKRGCFSDRMVEKVGKQEGTHRDISTQIQHSMKSCIIKL